ncbi:unnamed protein product, partial [Fusarium langsethiae]
MDNRPMSPLLIPTNHRFDSSTIGPFTPVSPRSGPKGFTQTNFSDHYGAAPCWQKTAFSSSVFILSPFGPDTEYMPFFNDISNTTLYQERPDFDFNTISETSGMRKNSVSSFAPSTASGSCEYFLDANAQTPFILSTQSFSGSESAEPMSPWSCGNDSPNPFPPRRQ